jgi:DNA primase
LYDKGRHIFALSQAKESIRRDDRVVVVEGNLDVVSSHQVGITHVVATAGTAMTENHLRAIKRLTGDVRLAYDGDKAGIAASERAIAIAAQVGVELSIISLPGDAKDPDELIQRDPRLWKQAIDTTMPAVDWILTQYAARVDMTSAAGKRAFTTAGLSVVRTLTDPVEQDHYERKMAEMIGSSLESVHAKLKQEKTEKQTLKKIKTSNESPVEESYVHEDNALAIAAVDGPSQELFAHMDVTMLHGEERQALARYLATHPGKPLTETPEELQKYDTYVKIVLLRAEQRYAEWDSNDRYYEMARVLRQIEHEYKKQTQGKLIDELREAEAADDEQRAEVLRVELNNLIKEIARGKR